MLHEEEDHISLSINISFGDGDYHSVNVFSTHPDDTVWTVLVEQFIRALNAYGFIIKGTNQLVIDPYGCVTRTKINEGPSDE